METLILTNANGHFNRTGGTLIASNIVLAPNLDADGDGQSNAAEALAGTDPLRASSVFRIVSAVPTNQNVRVTWTTVGGHSYVVQISTNATGSVTTNFVDISPVISVGGSSQGTTNFLHIGGATNKAGYYRVRQ